MADGRRAAGFKHRTRLAEARRRLLDGVSETDGVESVPVAEADGRVVADRVAAPRAVPHYDQAACDGWAVRAEDTAGASGRTPVGLAVGDAVGPNRAVRVNAGDPVSADADAVLQAKHADRLGERIEVSAAVAPGENVRPTGADVEAGTDLVTPGRRLRPSDLGLLRAAGVGDVAVRDRPEVAVLPTGGELVEDDPDPGEVVEVAGLIAARSVRRWGGRVRRRDPVADDRAAISEAIERDRDADLLVTTGGSGVGDADLVPEALEECGEVAVHGIAHDPGSTAGFGAVDGTPVVVLPGSPVACLVAAVQLLRPALARAGGWTAADHPTVEATLTEKVASEPGMRTYVRVELSGQPPAARPLRTGGSGMLSSVTAADGWVVVPESIEGFDADATVPVERWEWSP